MSVQIDGSTGNIIAIKADYSGDVSIGGTLTYEDVTNIDAVGLITARNGIKVDDLGVQVGTGATIDGATNTLTFLTNGSERLRINSSGNVGIGTDNPDATLKVNVASGNNGVVVQNISTANIGLFGARNGDATVQIGQWGSTASGTTFGLSNANLSFIYTTSYGTTHPSALALGTVSNKPIVFATNNTERARIDSSGNLGLGESSSIDARLHVNSGTDNTALFLESTDGDVNLGMADNAGSCRLLQAGGNLRFRTGGNANAFGTGDGERMVLDSSGRLLIGLTSSIALGTDSYLAQIKAVGASAGLGIIRTADSVAPPFFSLCKSRSDGIVQSGDGLGKIQWIAHDGNDYNNVSALINAEVDGTPGGDDVPGRLMFHTTADGASSPTERMRIDSSGIVKINQSGTGNIFRIQNTTSDESSMLIQNSTTGYSAGNGLYIGIGGDEKSYFWAYQNENMNFGTNNTTRMTIEGGGRIGLGPENAGSTVVCSTTQSAGTSYAVLSGTHSATTPVGGTISVRIWNNGNIQNTNNSYGSLSDSKLKENIVDANSQWDDIKDIRVRNYNFIEGETHTQLGVVAQEVETVSPGLVYETPDVDDDGNNLETVTKSVNYSVLYMKAVKALQEAQTRIETLETQNTTQQTQINDLITRVTALEG